MALPVCRQLITCCTASHTWAKHGRRTCASRQGAGVDPGLGWYPTRSQLLVKIQSSNQAPKENPNSPTPSYRDFCPPNMAKYDLPNSRQQTSASSRLCSAFLRIMTSDSDDLGKRGTTGTVTVSVVPEFSWGPLGICANLTGKFTPLWI
jgi:hypothetical protein